MNSPPVSGRPRAGVGRQLVPQLVGAQQQRHVGRVLEVGLPDDARPAVAGTLVVGGGELLQPEHPLPALGQVIRRGTAHATEPDDDNVVTHVLLIAAPFCSSRASAHRLILAISGSTTGSACTVAPNRVPR